MRLGIMQPYFLPYVGYFQLIAAVDIFIIYDNIKFTKKGWINRNRMLLNGSDALFSLPLKRDSDLLDVGQRELSVSFDPTKLLNQFKGAYGRAPYYKATSSLLESIVRYDDINLFRYIHHSLTCLCDYLDLNTEIRISSEIAIDHDLKNKERVLALCRAVGADTYINPIGGMELYTKNDFQAHGVELSFIKPMLFEYPQFSVPHVPWLSIVDVLMFNSLDSVRELVQTNYKLI